MLEEGEGKVEDLAATRTGTQVSSPLPLLSLLRALTVDTTPITPTGTVVLGIPCTPLLKPNEAHELASRRRPKSDFRPRRTSNQQASRKGFRRRWRMRKMARSIKRELGRRERMLEGREERGELGARQPSVLRSIMTGLGDRPLLEVDGAEDRSELKIRSLSNSTCRTERAHKSKPLQLAPGPKLTSFEHNRSPPSLARASSDIDGIMFASVKGGMVVGLGCQAAQHSTGSVR